MYWDEKGQGCLFAPVPESEQDTAMWKKFREYDERNPQIWNEFQNQTQKIVEEGYERIGADLIVRLIRWKSPIRAQGERVKIDHNFFPYYARKFMLENPEHKNLFEVRPLKRKHYGLGYNTTH